MQVLHNSDVLIYNPKEVFALCIKEHGDYLQEYMYMHSDNEHVHYFKNIITRKYITVNV